jgi:glutaredoxin 3
MRSPVPAVTIYTTECCSYCVRAKEYLQRKGVGFAEIDVTGDAAARADLIERSNGRRTVPQIFVGDVHVGGYTDLVALDAAGKFQPLLGASPGE